MSLQFGYRPPSRMEISISMTTRNSELVAKVARTRAAQGLPPTIQDPAALERAAAALRLMTPADEHTPRKHRRRDTS